MGYFFISEILLILNSLYYNFIYLSSINFLSFSYWWRWRLLHPSFHSWCAQILLKLRRFLWCNHNYLLNFLLLNSYWIQFISLLTQGNILLNSFNFSFNRRSLLRFYCLYLIICLNNFN